MNRISQPIARSPQAYRDWNEALATELFPRGRPGVPVYLAVHDGLLNECGSRRGIGGRPEFIQAVLQISATRGRVFACLQELLELWCDDECPGVPPVVAGLGFAVLAGADMVTDEMAAQTNYYFRLNALMGISNQGRPEGFEATGELWRQLQEWLRRERRGELVLRGLDGTQPYVGPVLSQCLVRSCDVDELLPLVASVRLSSQSPEPEDLVPALRGWLLRSGSRSRLARLLGRDPDDGALRQTAEALCTALETYEEHPVVRAARVEAGRASLAAQPNKHPSLRWKRARWLLRIPARADAEEPECLLTIGDRVALAKLDVREPASYDVEIAHAEASALLRGETSVADESGAEITPKPRDCTWLQNGALQSRKGSWHTVDVPSVGNEHVFVALSEGTVRAYKRFLTQPMPPVAGTTDIWPGDGLWVVHSALVRADAILPGDVPVRSLPSRLRLTGGLRIRRGVYLRGALPTIVEDDATSVRIEREDGAGSPVVCQPGDLEGLDLQEGGYVVHSGSASTRFFVLDARWRECAPPEHAPLDPQVSAALDHAALRGAQLTASDTLHAAYIPPGVHYRLHAREVFKGVAHPEDGVHEHRTAVPIQELVYTKRRPAGAPLRAAELFSENDHTPAPQSAETRDALNRLLECVSARGTGTVDSIREFCSGISTGSAGWHSAVSALEDLGHVDICWKDRVWTAAPALLLPRAAGQVCILTGVRSRQTLQWLHDNSIDATADERANDAGRSPMPDAIIAPREAVIRSESALQSVGARIVPAAPSFHLALRVRPLHEKNWWTGASFSPPISQIRQTLERWDPLLLRWCAAEDLDKNALYRWRHVGLRVHYIATKDLRAVVTDPSAAKWSLAPPDRSYFVYDRSQRRLLVPSALELPRIWRRICTIASGLTALRRDRVLIYEEISLEVARAAAVRLNQARAEGVI